jgi:hypothetical protein
VGTMLIKLDILRRGTNQFLPKIGVRTPRGLA